MRHYLAVIFLSLVILSCATAPPERVVSVETSNIKVERSNNIDKLEKEVDKASKNGDEVARLTALTKLLKEKTRVAEQTVTDLKTESKKTIADLQDAKDKAFQELAASKLRWFAVLMGAIVLASIFVGIFQPQLVTWCWRAALAAGVLASLALFFVKLLPYLWWIGGVLLLLCGIGYLLWNRLSDKTRLQTTAAIEKYKKEIPDYKNKLGEMMDHDVDRFNDMAREHLGLKPKTSNAGSEKNDAP